MTNTITNKCPQCKNIVRETFWRSRWRTPEGIVIIVIETSRRIYEHADDKRDPKLLKTTMTYLTEGGQQVVIQRGKQTCQVMTPHGPVQCINAASGS